MKKSIGISTRTQIGRMRIVGLIGLQLLAALVIVIAAITAFAHFREQVKTEVEQDLLAVAELKNQQITDYLNERINDAEVTAQRHGIWTLVDEASKSNFKGLNTAAPISEITRQIRSAYGYSDIAVFDANLKPVYPRDADHSYSEEVLDALKKSKQTGSPQIADLHLHEDAAAYFGVIHPIRASGKTEGPIIGLVLIEMSAHPNLNRLASSWPTIPSKTGESFLARHDKDRITYLSPLRHQREMRPLLTHRSLEEKNLFSAKAIREEFGIIQNGVDYRGVGVLGAALPITGTPWIVLVKMDRDEAYAGIASLGKTIGSLAICFILISGIALYYLWRGRTLENEAAKTALKQALEKSSEQVNLERAARTRVETSFGKIFDASPLPKQIHNLQTLDITAINGAHERLFGYTLKEVSDINSWFEKIFPDTGSRDALRKLWLSVVAKAHDSGSVAESPEMTLECRDGRKRVMLANISIVDDNIIVVWTDLTELRNSEAALLESEKRFRGMVEQTISGFYVVVDGRIAYINPRVTEMVGWGHDEVIDHGPDEFVDGPSAQEMHKAQQRLLSGERTVTIKLNALRKDGSTMPLAAHSTLGVWDGKQAIVAILEDLTERLRAEEKISSYMKRLEGSMRAALQACAKMVELRDPYTAGHQNRVGLIASAIASEMGWEKDRCEALELMGLVHDIGKISVPAEFLTKPTKLSPYEFEIIKGHAQAGYEILKDLHFDDLPVADIVHQHHERMNGSGYPQGLKGEQILPEARILAVADVLESMASYRPYRPALGIDKALSEIETNSGKLYDPDVVNALLRLVREKNFVIPK